MQIVYTTHWLEKRKRRRKDISGWIIKYCIMKSPKIKDRRWKYVYNAICRIPPPNKLLKVVYKEKGKDIKIITAYWLYEG